MSRTKEYEEMSYAYTSDHYDFKNDPLKRLVDSPFPPKEMVLTNPKTGARVKVKVGPNMGTTHGTEKQKVAIPIERNGRKKTLLVSGDTFMEGLLQLPSFRKMYRANPDADILYMICHAAKDAETGFARDHDPNKAKILRTSAAKARELGMRNNFHGGRDTVLTTIPAAAAHNKGWASSYYNNGNEYIKDHPHTRYPSSRYGRR